MYAKKNPGAGVTARGAEATSQQDCSAEHIKTRAAEQARPTYAVTLRPEPGVDPIRALRSLLKRALRNHKLRCLSVEEVQSSAPISAITS
jgi:hypothetical protein